MTDHHASSDRDRLLADTYYENWASGPASTLAARAARTVRQRHAIQRLSATGATVALLVSGAWWFASSSGPLAPSSVRTTDTYRSISPPQTHTPTRSYEIISDSELMSSLRDQPVMILTGANGPKKVIWLDAPEPVAVEAPSA